MTQKITTSGAGLSGAASTATTSAAGLRCGGWSAFHRRGRDPDARPRWVWSTRHPLSLLGLGGLGWIQITNFMVTGFMVAGPPFVAAAVGMRRVPHSGQGSRGQA
jgi:hypothetical protein